MTSRKSSCAAGIVFPAILVCVSAADLSAAEEIDQRLFGVMRGDDAQMPSRFRRAWNWSLGQADGKVFLARDKVPDERMDAGALGGWIAPDFVEDSKEKKGPIYLKTGRAGKMLYLQYPLDGESTLLTCGDEAGRGKEWEWALEGVYGYYLKPVDGKYAGWTVDFGEAEEAVRLQPLIGEEPLKIKYVRRPAQLVKEPGKYSVLFLYYGRKGGFDPKRDVGK